jgi:hypothetical protein
VSETPKQRLAKVLFPALADDGSQELREQVAREVPAVMASNGLRLQFMPRHIRKRAVRNFRPTEYANHCDHGGHPNPAGRMLLRPSAGLDRLSFRVRWLDLAQHLSDVWECFVAALPLYDPRMEREDALYAPSRSPDDGERIGALLAEWHEADQAALTASVPEMEAQLA